MWKPCTHVLDRMAAGPSEAELAMIETPRATLRLFVARRGSGHVAVLSCRSRGDACYAPLNPVYLNGLIQALERGQEFLNAAPAPSTHWLDRLKEFFFWPFHGRVIRPLGRIRCEAFVHLMVYITEWYDERYLAVSFQFTEASGTAILDAEAIDTLLAALHKATGFFPARSATPLRA